MVEVFTVSKSLSCSLPSDGMFDTTNDDDDGDDDDDDDNNSNCTKSS